MFLSEDGPVVRTELYSNPEGAEKDERMPPAQNPTLRNLLIDYGPGYQMMKFPELNTNKICENIHNNLGKKVTFVFDKNQILTWAEFDNLKIESDAYALLPESVQKTYKILVKSFIKVVNAKDRCEVSNPQAE